MPLIVRSLRSKSSFGFGRAITRTLENRSTLTFLDRQIDSAVLASIRSYVAAGYMEVVSSSPEHGLPAARAVSSLNRMTITIGVGGTVAFPRVANSHTVTLGGIDFTLAEANATVSATTALASFLEDLAASAEFAATGAVVDSSGLLATPVDTKATGTLTAADVAANNETVVIGGQTYTFKTALTAPTTANEVLLGVSASASLDNLIAAINKAAGGGTTYGSATVANAYVTAAAGAGDTVVLTAIEPGTVGNAIATTETGGDLSFGASTLTGGIDGRAYVIIDGQGVADWEAFVADSDVTAVGTELVVIETEEATTTDTVNTGVPIQITYTVVAGDVTRGFIDFETGLTDLTTNFAVRITRSGTRVLHDGSVLVKNSSNIQISNDGSTDFAAGDVIKVFAAGAD